MDWSQSIGRLYILAVPPILVGKLASTFSKLLTLVYGKG